MLAWMTGACGPLAVVLGLPRRRRPPADPFETLTVQLALTRLDREISKLRTTRDEPFACAHHLRAAVTAYDQLLDEACRMAGVTPGHEPGSSLRRLVAEAELKARGWDW